MTIKLVQGKWDHWECDALPGLRFSTKEDAESAALREEVRKQQEPVRQQRDELVEALNLLVHHCDCIHTVEGVDATNLQRDIASARAVLARVEGGMP